MPSPSMASCRRRQTRCAAATPVSSLSAAATRGVLATDADVADEDLAAALTAPLLRAQLLTARWQPSDFFTYVRFVASVVCDFLPGG